MIDRETFATINRTMGGVDTFKLRQRRGQIPLLDQEQRRGRGFFLIEAYLTTLVEEFRIGFDGPSLSLAAAIVGDAIPGLKEKWSDIVHASNPDCGDILVGRAVIPGGQQIPFVGLLSELCDTHSLSGEGLVSVVALSASRAFAVFDARCIRAGIELPEDYNLWAEVSGSDK